MKPEELKHFEDLIFKAVQSGKQETSGLVDMIMHKIEKELDPAIQKAVNGKLETYIQKDLIWKDKDMEWKENREKWEKRAEPVVKAFENTSWLSSVFVQSLKLLGMLGVAVVAYITIKNLFK